MPSADSVNATLVPLAVLGVFALARRFAPPREPVHLDPAHLAEMRDRHASLNAISTAAAFVAMPVTVIALSRGLTLTGGLVPRFGEPSRFVTLPSKYAWMAIGLFVGIGAAAVVLTVIGRAILGPARYDAFEAVSNERNGFNSDKLAQWVIVPVVALAFAAIPVLLHSHTRFGEREMTTYPVLGWAGVRRSYTDVIRIERATGAPR